MRAFCELKAAITEFETRMQLPFFYGSTVSAVDVAFFPWAFRILECRVLEHYRGDDYQIKPSEFPKLSSWFRAMLELQPILSTLPNTTALLDTYARYARGDARSKVAEAVRSGLQAHEHDKLGKL